MSRFPLLEQNPTTLTSIGEDAPTLLAFKVHAGLPTASTWTEADYLLKKYLNAAELEVDRLVDRPNRSRAFTLSFDQWERIGQDGQFYGHNIPASPLTAALVTISWTADDASTGTYTENTDFTIYNRTSFPEIVFPLSFYPPSTCRVYCPYIARFTVGNTLDEDINLIAIFELANAYYMNPAAMSQKLEFLSPTFQANIDALKTSFL